MPTRKTKASRKKPPRKRATEARTRDASAAVLPPLGERPEEIRRLLANLDERSADGGPRDALVVLADCRWEHAVSVAAMLVLAKKGRWKVGGAADPAHLREAVAELTGRVYVGWVPYKLASTVVVDLLLESQDDPPPRLVATFEALRAEIERLASLERGERVAALVLDTTFRLLGFVRDQKRFVLSPGGEG